MVVGRAPLVPPKVNKDMPLRFKYTKKRKFRLKSPAFISNGDGQCFLGRPDVVTSHLLSFSRKPAQLAEWSEAHVERSPKWVVQIANQ